MILHLETLKGTGMDKVARVKRISGGDDEREIVLGVDEKTGKPETFKISTLGINVPHIGQIFDRVNIWADAEVKPYEIFILNNRFGIYVYPDKGEWSNVSSNQPVICKVHIPGTVFEKLGDPSKYMSAESINKAIPNICDMYALNELSVLDLSTDSFIHEYMHRDRNIKPTNSAQLLQINGDSIGTVDFVTYGFKKNADAPFERRGLTDIFTTTERGTLNIPKEKKNEVISAQIALRTRFDSFLAVSNFYKWFKIIDHTDFKIIISNNVEPGKQQELDNYKYITADSTIHYTIDTGFMSIIDLERLFISIQHIDIPGDEMAQIKKNICNILMSIKPLLRDTK